MQHDTTLNIYLVQPENQKHWTYQEWLWIMTNSRHLYVLQALRQFAAGVFTLEADDIFTNEDVQTIRNVSQWLAAGNRPDDLPLPSTNGIPWIPS